MSSSPTNVEYSDRHRAADQVDALLNLHRVPRESMSTERSLPSRVEFLLKLLAEVGQSGVEFDDARIGWVTVQIDRDTWDTLRELRP